MRLFIKVFGVVLTVAALIAAGTLPGLTQEKIVRAKLGIAITSGKETRPAKSRDSLKTGDSLRIYVHPEESSYVYVVHTDGKAVTLLNMVEQRVQSSTLVLPRCRNSMRWTARAMSRPSRSSAARRGEPGLVLVNSQMTLIAGLHAKRVAQERELELVQKSERPFSISGTVRGAGNGPDGDPSSRSCRSSQGSPSL